MCGASRLTLTQAPTARFFCHCEICQEVYGKPYSDATVVNAATVTISPDSPIIYKNYWSGLQRGVCSECQQPVVGLLAIAPFIKAAFIPTIVLGERFSAPKASAHIFYHRHLDPVIDDIPKINGFVKSELRAASIVLSGLYGKTPNK